MRNVTSQIDILFPWWPPLLCFFWIFWWLRKIFALWVLALFYWILCTHFCRLCVLKWHALLLAYHSFWDYGDAQCSPMMYSYKRALLCHTHHLVEPKSFKCSRFWIFCRSSIWCSTIWLLPMLCLVLYILSCTCFVFQRIMGEWWFHLCARGTQIYNF